MPYGYSYGKHMHCGLSQANTAVNFTLYHNCFLTCPLMLYFHLACKSCLFYTSEATTVSECCDCAVGMCYLSVKFLPQLTTVVTSTM